MPTGGIPPWGGSIPVGSGMPLWCGSPAGGGRVANMPAGIIVAGLGGRLCTMPDGGATHCALREFACTGRAMPPWTSVGPGTDIPGHGWWAFGKAPC